MGKHEAFRQWGEMYGGIYKIMEGGIVSIVITDPQLGRLEKESSHSKNLCSGCSVNHIFFYFILLLLFLVADSKSFNFAFCSFY